MDGNHLARTSQAATDIRAVVHLRDFLPIFLSPLICLGILISPSVLNQIDYLLIGQSLEIHFEEESPAFAAFEDLAIAIADDSIRMYEDLEVIELAPLPPGREAMVSIAEEPASNIALAGLVMQKSTLLTSQKSTAPTLWTDVNKTVFTPSVASPASAAATSAMVARTQTSTKLPQASHTKKSGQILIGQGDKLIPLNEITNVAQNDHTFTKEQEVETRDQTPEDVSLQLQGQLEIAGGLHYTGIDNKLQVFIDDGTRKTYATVDSGEGQYWLRTKRWGGIVVAQLVSMDGEVLGQGHAFLEGEPKTKIDLKIIPVNGTLAGRVVSYTPTTEPPQYVAGAHVQVTGLGEVKAGKKGEYFLDQVHERSQQIAAATQEGYWGTMLIQKSEPNQIIPLFDQAMVDLWLNSAMVDLNARNEKSIIWGQVKYQEKFPVADAVVELSGEQNFKVVYFNEFGLPDSNLKQTSRNGLYAIILAEQGLQMVRAQWMGQVSAAELLVTEKKFVTKTDLSFSLHQTTNLKVRRIETPDISVQSTVRLLDSGKELSLPGGEGEITTRQSTGLQIIEIEPEATDLESMRVDLLYSEPDLTVPIVSRSLLMSFVASKKINRHTNHGMFMTWLKGNDLQVRLEDGLFNANDVVYISSTGEILKEYDSAGCYMLAFNVPEGLQTVGFHQGDESMTRLIVVDTNLITYLPSVFP